MADLYVKTLQRAAEIVGGEQELSLRLKVTPSHLALWLRGLEKPPGAIFLRAVDLVMEYEMARLAARAQDADGAPAEEPSEGPPEDPPKPGDVTGRRP